MNSEKVEIYIKFLVYNHIEYDKHKVNKVNKDKHFRND